MGGPSGGMDAAVEDVVERIHSSTVRIVLYLGGGASQVLPAQLPASLPGCVAIASSCGGAHTSFFWKLGRAD